MESTQKDQARALVRRWASEKNSYRTFDLFRNELAVWASLTGEDAVSSACEIGCGSGVFLTTAYITGLIQDRATGLDAVKESEGTSLSELERTREFIVELGLDHDLHIEYGVFPDDMPDGEFDLLIFRNVLHHIYESDDDTTKRCIRDLGAVRDSISPGGHIYLLEPTVPWYPKRALVNLFRTRIQNRSRMDWNEKRTPSAWVRILEAAGYSEPKVASVPSGLFYGWPGWESIDVFLSFEHLITARR